MLPDFPTLKAELNDLILAEIRRRVQRGSPVLSMASRFTQHEGVQMRHEQYGGTTQLSEPEELRAEFRIPIEEATLLVGARLEAKLDEIADVVIARETELMFRRINESCEQAGTAMDAQEKPISARLLLDLFRSAQIDFDAKGEPKNVLVVHPDMVPSLKRIEEEFNNDPQLRRERDAILAGQREAWIARESNRRLVD